MSEPRRCIHGRTEKQVCVKCRDIDTLQFRVGYETDGSGNLLKKPVLYHSADATPAPETGAYAALAAARAEVEALIERDIQAGGGGSTLHGLRLARNAIDGHLRLVS